MLPIVVEASASESWLDSVIKFSQELRSHFGRRLLRVIALPSPDQEVHDSNVLVVLDRYDLGDVDAVIEIASRIDERINPLVASADEEDEVEAFLQAGGRDVQANQV
ncbi:MAG: hypothetical protein QI199_06580 [Candidatus Korarchaeota archaeon]|nr:hypothetical protein [Candidatus Korarchaeota archaeon]